MKTVFDSFKLDEIPEKLQKITYPGALSYLRQELFKYLPNDHTNKTKLNNILIRCAFMELFLRQSGDFNKLMNYLDYEEITREFDKEEIEFIKNELMERISFTGQTSISNKLLKLHKFFDKIQSSNEIQHNLAHETNV